MSSSSRLSSILLLFLFVFTLITASEGNFYENFDITWGGNQRAKILNGGQLLTLSLDKTSGSGFRSKHEYLFGRIDMQIKLVPGNSAGTVTTYYLKLSTFCSCLLKAQPMMRLTSNFWATCLEILTYSIPMCIARERVTENNNFISGLIPRKLSTPSLLSGILNVFMVDNIPIRVFNNMESMGVPFPSNQPMRIYSSLWNADDWATRGGLVKTDWAHAPFTASYRNFNANACIWSSSQSSCASKSTNSLQTTAWQDQTLDAPGRNRLGWVQKMFMIYNYCTDFKRFPQGLPPECKRSRFL
ncbi:Xyloglucan endo-transglycosylase, putative [Theobroma cacao]|uniref:Xyloglucan endotransglucosylase/hydrolase n=1 Tax=Theobroma cacao TaxID=3641 RepID=A0A061DSN5_THECC|nr:Xyloglucan endo-transglycosylase, putative [Theobroma cacao]